jgi:hypothetical protein
MTGVLAVFCFLLVTTAPRKKGEDDHERFVTSGTRSARGKVVVTSRCQNFNVR